MNQPTTEPGPETTSEHTSELSSASARRVQGALAAHGLSLQVVELPQSTRTAPEAAQAIGCQVSQIVKSLIFRGAHSGRPILIIASGSNRVDEKKMAEQIGEPIEKPDAEFVRQQTGFAIGGVPPIGHVQRLTTYVDRDLLSHQEIWAAAGTPHAVFKLTPAELTLLTDGSIVSIA